MLFIYSFSQHFNTYISILGASLMAKNKYIPIKMLKENEQIENMTSVREKKKSYSLYHDVGKWYLFWALINSLW